jgi:hypothetical protein
MSITAMPLSPRAQRRANQRETALRQQAEAAAKLQSLPVANSHAAGIDVGDRSHWVCVEATPDGADPVREFPAHTPGLRQLVDWLERCAVTTIAIEATGVYGHVLFLTLLEAGFQVVVTSAKFTHPIQGRPKTDQRDCQWIQRLHRHGLLPSIFQPDDATQTLRDYVRQRTNLVRLSGQHIQRRQKALQLMNLKLTNVLGDVTGVTGLKIIRAILNGDRDPVELAKLRDRRCKHSVAEIATALDGQYRDEHVLELRCSLAMWEKYQEMIAVVDASIDRQLRSKSYLEEYLRRQRSRLGAPKAITATAHKLGRILYHLLKYGEKFVQQEEAHYAEEVRERLERQLHRRARELGYAVKKIEPPAEAMPPPTEASGK